MKRRLILPLLLLALILTGCRSQVWTGQAMQLGKRTRLTISAPEGVTLTPEADSVTSTGGTFLLRNDGDRALSVSTWYSVEQLQENGKWFSLKPVEGNKNKNTVWTDEDYVVAPGETRTLACNWTWLFGKLEPGTYRLVKTATLPESGEDEAGPLYLAGEFTVS